MSEKGRIQLIRKDVPSERQHFCPLLSIGKTILRVCETEECAFWVQHDGFNGIYGHCGFVHPGHHGLNWKLEGDNYA